MVGGPLASDLDPALTLPDNCRDCALQDVGEYDEMFFRPQSF